MSEKETLNQILTKLVELCSPKQEYKGSGDGKIVALNIGLFLLLVTLASFWLLIATNLFPLVGGFLGLGGIFAWITFVSKIVDGNRQDQLRIWFDRTVLQSKKTVLGLLGAAVLLVVAGPLMTRTIELSNTNRVSPLRITLSILGKDDQSPINIARLSIPALEKAKVVHFPVFILSDIQIQVDVPDHPLRSIELEKVSFTKLELPERLWEPAPVLIRSDHNCALVHNEDDLKLEIISEAPTKKSIIIEFAGHPTWLFTGKPIPIPEPLLENWRYETGFLGLVEQNENLTKNDLMAMHVLWSQPKSVALPMVQAAGLLTALKCDIEHGTECTEPDAVTVEQTYENINFREIVIGGC